MDNFIGLDVSKSTVSVFIPKGECEIEIANTAQGFTSLFSKLKKLYKKEHDSLVFVYEPTSSYSNTLELFCANKQIRVFKINPKASHNFAKALSLRSKTDKVDARMLTKAGTLAREGEIHIPVVDRLVSQINDLMSYYQLLVKQRVQTSNHLVSFPFTSGSLTSKFCSAMLVTTSEILLRFSVVERMESHAKSAPMIMASKIYKKSCLVMISSSLKSILLLRIMRA